MSSSQLNLQKNQTFTKRKIVRNHEGRISQNEAGTKIKGNTAKSNRKDEWSKHQKPSYGLRVVSA